MSQRTSAAITLALVAMAWGAIPLIVRTVDLPAEQLVAARLWLGAIPFLLIVAKMGNLVPQQGLRMRIVLVGVIRAVHWAAFFWSLKTTTVAIALVLVYLAPVALAALGPTILGEPTRRRVVVALAVAMIGVVLVARPGAGISFQGLISGLVAAATLATLVLIGKPAAVAIGGFRLAALEHSVAALVMTPWMIAALANVSWEPSGSLNAPSYWWQLLILGVALTGVANVFYWRSVARLDVATAGVVVFLEPASAVVWAALALDEWADPGTWLGVLLVVGAGIGAAIAPSRDQVLRVKADDTGV